MKFLCLHGMGTNSSIFESQLSSTLPYLEAQGHEFIFVDGLIECAPAQGKLRRNFILRVVLRESFDLQTISISSFPQQKYSPFFQDHTFAITTYLRMT